MRLPFTNGRWRAPLPARRRPELVPYRLVGHADDQNRRTAACSAGRWGVAAAARYHRLILAAAAAVGEAPTLPGSREESRVSLNAHPSSPICPRAGRGAEDRVADPRHLIVYRVASDGMVEILSVVHDRMLLPRAARQARRPPGNRPVSPARTTFQAGLTGRLPLMGRSSRRLLLSGRDRCSSGVSPTVRS